LAQLAQVFRLILRYQLPSTITKYGGLELDEKGEIVSGPIIFPWGGPFDKYEDLYVEELEKQLRICGNYSACRRLEIKSISADPSSILP
jgi:hypothetical protein